MQKQLITTVATLTIVIMLAVATFAGLTKKIMVNIPFEFMVNGKLLPAGQYTVIRSSQTIVVLTSRENHVAVGAMVMKNNKEKILPPSLVFHRYGQNNFLTQISDGTSAGVMLPTSKAERAAAKNNTDFLARTKTPEIISLTAQLGH